MSLCFPWIQRKHSRYRNLSWIPRNHACKNTLLHQTWCIVNFFLYMLHYYIKNCYVILEVPAWLWHLSGGTDTVLRWVFSLYGNISPHLNVSCNTFHARSLSSPHLGLFSAALTFHSFLVVCTLGNIISILTPTSLETPLLGSLCGGEW